MDISKEREAFESEFSKIKSDIAFWLHTWDEEMQGYNHPVMCWFWHMWQAAKATPEGFVLVPRELSDEKADDQAMFVWNFNLDLFKSDNRDMSAIQIEEFRLKWCLNKARTLQQDYKAMIEAQEQSHD